MQAGVKKSNCKCDLSGSLDPRLCLCCVAPSLALPPPVPPHPTPPRVLPTTRPRRPSQHNCLPTKRPTITPTHLFGKADEKACLLSRAFSISSSSARLAASSANRCRVFSMAWSAARFKRSSAVNCSVGEANGARNGKEGHISTRER